MDGSAGTAACHHPGADISTAAAESLAAINAREASRLLTELATVAALFSDGKKAGAPSLNRRCAR
jgi:hypothetical protein